MDLRGKRLLVLGGTYATYDLVKLAKSKGVYVIVTDNVNQDSPTKQMADEVVLVSTDDIESLKRLVIDKQIDGAFCGPSEFNINNLVHLCEEVNLPCYCTPKQWSLCSNKKTFKEFCLNNNVPTAKEYHLEEFQNDTIIDYPVIVKPVDGCSSKGISICENSKDVISAYKFALNQSKSKKVIIEQYIDNGGLIFSFRYVLDNGNYYPYLTFDTYIVDPIERKYLISAFTYFPSKFNGVFYSDLDKNIRQMFANMGLKNGVAFVQAIPYKGKIYCHEMGYRLSGGMIYKITQPLMGINDMEMMLRYSLGKPILTIEEKEQITNFHYSKSIAQLMIPLNCGTIGSILGLEEILKIKGVEDFLQYYFIGDTIKEIHLGTLNQHFGRFTISGNNLEDIIKIVNIIQDKLVITSTNNQNMYTMLFDTNRLKTQMEWGGKLLIISVLYKNPQNFESYPFCKSGFMFNRPAMVS